MTGAAPRSLKIRQAIDWWERLRGDREMPTRRDIDPAGAPALLPHIILLDVQHDPPDFRYRLIGTEIDRHMSAPFTGRWMSEIPHQQAGSRIRANCETVVRERKPLVGDTPCVGPPGDFAVAGGVVVPLPEGGVGLGILPDAVG